MLVTQLSSVQVKFGIVNFDGTKSEFEFARDQNVHLKELTNNGLDSPMEAFRPLPYVTTNSPAVRVAFETIVCQKYLT